MKESGASQGQSASELISKRIAELGDWRGETLSRMRKHERINRLDIFVQSDPHFQKLRNALAYRGSPYVGVTVSG
jgi:hypothetical protein